MKPEYLNDVIMNSYFKLLGWSYELRKKVTEFFKETQINDEKSRLLLNYKFYDNSYNINKNSEFKLITYLHIGEQFEVYKDH